MCLHVMISYRCRYISYVVVFFFKQTTAYVMRISDWSSDVCSSDLLPLAGTVKASNHTILTLADEIGKKMEKGGFLRNPIINVEVIQMVSQTATVLAKVTSPGVVPLDREMTVSTVLGRVGGALPTGAGYVVIQKGHGPPKQAVISDLIKGGEFDPEIGRAHG